jgi:hypothetical protein
MPDRNRSLFAHELRADHRALDLALERVELGQDSGRGDARGAEEQAIGEVPADGAHGLRSHE